MYSLTLLIVTLLPLAVTATRTASPLPADFECPTSIQATVPGCGENRHSTHNKDRSSPYGTMDSVHDIMLTCSGITELHLRITFGGCFGWPDRWHFPFNQAGGDVYPSRLQTLVLSGYNFDASAWTRCQPPSITLNKDIVYPGLWYRVAALWNDWEEWVMAGKALEWMRMRNLPEEQKMKRNIHLWLDAMDFSAISNLTLQQLFIHESKAFTSTLPGRLPALKVLSISHAWGLDFLRALPGGSLSHLSWRSSGLAGETLKADPSRYLQDPDATLREIWLRHGGLQLEDLEFRGVESTYRDSREVLPVSHLRAIAASAPNIRRLAIDLDRDDGIWPEEELTVLATEFPALESLTLYVEMSSECSQQVDQFMNSQYTTQPGYSSMEDIEVEDQEEAEEEEQSSWLCIGDDRFAKPLVNENTVAEVFTLMRRLNVESGRGKLREVNLRSGEWPRSWDGPLHDPSWLEGRKAWAKCWIETVDDEERVFCDGKDTLSEYYDDEDEWVDQCDSNLHECVEMCDGEL